MILLLLWNMYMEQIVIEWNYIKIMEKPFVFDWNRGFNIIHADSTILYKKGHEKFEMILGTGLLIEIFEKLILESHLFYLHIILMMRLLEMNKNKFFRYWRIIMYSFGWPDTNTIKIYMNIIAICMSFNVEIYCMKMRIRWAVLL